MIKNLITKLLSILVKIIYLFKYIILNLLVAIQILFGYYPAFYELYDDKVNTYFTKIGDKRRAFRLYLIRRDIKEKPYFLENGFNLKVEFQKSIIEMPIEELKSNYPLSEIRKKVRFYTQFYFN